MWIMLATLSGATRGCGDLALKLALRNIRPVDACIALYGLGLLFWIPTFIVAGINPKPELVDLPASGHALVFCRSLLQIGAYAPIFIILRDLPLSTYAALRALSPALSVIVGVLIYSDQPGMVASAGVIATMLGVVLMAFAPKPSVTGSCTATETPDRRQLTSIALAITAATCSGLMPVYDKSLLHFVPAHPFVLQSLSDLYRMALLVVFLRVLRKDISYDIHG